MFQKGCASAREGRSLGLQGMCDYHSNGGALGTVGIAKKVYQGTQWGVLARDCAMSGLGQWLLGYSTHPAHMVAPRTPGFSVGLSEKVDVNAA
jgi:hypothetical protein